MTIWMRERLTWRTTAERAHALSSGRDKWMPRYSVELVPSIARVALECIGNSDALYHNVEHTMLVTLAGHGILRGRALHAHMPPEVGYVRGIFLQDDENGFLIDDAGHKAKLPRGASDAALLPYHVDRSKLYVMERLQGIEQLDAARIARAVEGSRFPSSMPGEVERIDEEAALLRPPT